MGDSAPEVQLRRGTTPDAEAFRACLDAVARERRHLAMVEAPPLEQVEAFLALAEEQRMLRWLAWAGPRIVGWCDVIPMQREGFRHSGTLGMGLLPEFRGRGLGAALLEATLTDATQSGLARVELEVYASNEPALRLYRRHGFVEEGRKLRARVLDGRSEDIVCLARALRDTVETWTPESP